MFICLFVCQLQTATTATTTHDQLQAVPLFPSSPPAGPRLMSAAQLLSLIIKGNKLFSIDLHAASSTVQKPADTPHRRPRNRMKLTLKTRYAAATLLFLLPLLLVFHAVD